MALQMQRGLWTARTNRRHLSIVCAKKGGKPQKGKSALDGLLKKKQEVEEAKVVSGAVARRERHAGVHAGSVVSMPPSKMQWMCCVPGSNFG